MEKVFVIVGVALILTAILSYGMAIRGNIEWIKRCNQKCSKDNWVARPQLWNTEQVNSSDKLFTAEEASIYAYPTIANYWCTCVICDYMNHPYAEVFWKKQNERFCVNLTETDNTVFIEGDFVESENKTLYETATETVINYGR